MSTPMHAVVADDPGERLVTLNRYVPEFDAEPPSPPWLSEIRMVDVVNVFAAFTSLAVHAAQLPDSASETTPTTTAALSAIFDRDSVVHSLRRSRLVHFWCTAIVLAPRNSRRPNTTASQLWNRRFRGRRERWTPGAQVRRAESGTCRTRPEITDECGEGRLRAGCRTPASVPDSATAST